MLSAVFTAIILCFVNLSNISTALANTCRDCVGFGTRCLIYHGGCRVDYLQLQMLYEDVDILTLNEDVVCHSENQQNECRDCVSFVWKCLEYHDCQDVQEQFELLYSELDFPTLKVEVRCYFNKTKKAIAEARGAKTTTMTAVTTTATTTTTTMTTAMVTTRATTSATTRATTRRVTVGTTTTTRVTTTLTVTTSSMSTSMSTTTTRQTVLAADESSNNPFPKQAMLMTDEM